MTDGAWVDAYLHRIEVDPDTKGEVGIDQLRHLQLAHLRAVPFENLSIHLGEPIVLQSESLLEKVVERRRGGFCYELNGAFAALLEAVGYHVHMHSARVHGVAGVSPPFDHMALTVELEHLWLVDVGFGAFTHHPVRLDVDDSVTDQVDAAGVVRLEPTTDGDIDVLLDGKPQYRVDRRPYALGDFGPTCWWQATSPDSHFTRSLTCSMLTGDGRVTISDDRLIVTTGGVRQERVLADTEIIEAYRSHFGIRLHRAPRLSRRD